MSMYLGNHLVVPTLSVAASANTPHFNLMAVSNAAWSRPPGWPNLDSLNLTASGDDYIYMTYDANKEIAAVSLYITGTDISVYIGHISNGSYVSEATISGSSNVYQLWLDSYSGYKVVKVTGTSITKCYCYNATNGDSQVQLGQQQPMLERIAYLPHFNCNASSSNCWGTYMLEREKLMTGPSTALTTLNYMWTNCHSLQDLDVSQVDTSNVTNMSYAFNYCLSLRTLNLSNWNVNKVTNFSYMFCYCIYLKNLTIQNWTANTGNNITFNYMFQHCEALENIPGIENLVTSQATSLQYMFDYCKNLNDVSFIKTWNTTNVTSLAYLFDYCNSLVTIDLSSFATGKVTSMASMFAYCYNLKTIVFPAGWSTENVTSMASMFHSCYSLREISGISSWNTGKVTSFSSMFQNCWSLESLNLNSWTTSACTNMSSMFYYCYNLKTVGTLANWNTSKVTNMSSMFNYCHSLTEVPTMTNWDFSKVTSISSMFQYCYSIKEVILPNITLTACTTMASMFNYCYNLETVNLGGWSIPAMTSTAPSTFLGNCYSLKNILGITIPALNISLTKANSLTHESLLVVLNALPSTGTTRTINIVTANINRLSATEKAIATNKGWTLAN